MKEKIEKYFDKGVIVLLFLFASTLTNSIFLNQIGYFGALLIIIFKYIKDRKNLFSKVGLEYLFILFLTAEFISAILSGNKAQAFQNLSKRALLIPIVYVMVASLNNKKRTELILNAFLYSAFITIIIYIGAAYKHFAHQLYYLESKGPSTFQYVMTAGGLISFFVVISFAFLINEKFNKKKFFIYLSFFIVGIIGLIASYTRAAWLGTIAALITILILKRQWLVLTIGTAVIAFFLFYSHNESNISIINLREDGNQLFEINKTDGRIQELAVIDSFYCAADYEGGLKIFYNNQLLRNYEAPSPVSGVRDWNKNYLISFLVDSRILLYKKDTVSHKLEITNEFVSPGRTMDYKTFAGKLYAADLDSGLTIYNNPEELDDTVRMSNYKEINGFSINKNYFAWYSNKRDSLFIENIKEGIPSKLVYSDKLNGNYTRIWLSDSLMFIQEDNILNIFSLGIEGIKQVQEIATKTPIDKLKEINNEIYVSSTAGVIYKIEKKKKFYLEEFYKHQKRITDFDIIKNQLLVGDFKRNRLASMFDLYHDTNIERMNQWRTGYKIFQDHPLFGVGDIDLQHVYAEYKDYYLKENFGHLHNNYIHFIVILGLFGFFIVLALFYKMGLIYKNIYNSLKDIPIASSFSIGAFASFIGFLFSGLAEWNFGDQEIITMVWFVLGLSIAFFKVNKDAD
ncbi:MAG: O-antigen ligase family protein [Melioribacteraceae bacterium]|nr:O-antigen ligase family protein [Melioribacteraceae bacterium]